MQNNVYECVSINNIINKLKLEKTNQIGSYIYVKCPFCQYDSGKSGYMKINTINNLYICKNCEASGTSIDLYAKLKYISTKEAFKQILKETPVLENIPYVYNNPIKDEYYRDLVYHNFLELQTLNESHRDKLIAMNFSEEYIINKRFKSIETRENKKKEICSKLQKQGLRLDGIPGFYQSTDFKWTYKSHKGIFVPVTLDNRIQGLRIFLDDKYNNDTENIWFSSNNEYAGTKAYNWPTIIKDENTNWLDVYNSKDKNSIIIATEMILAHKLFYNSNKIVIGIPNNIEKDMILNIAKRMNATEVFLYADKYTILHTSTFMYENVVDTLEKEGIKVYFRTALTESSIINELKQDEEKLRIA